LRAEGDPRMTGNERFFDTIRYTGPRKHSWEEWLKNNQNPTGVAPKPAKGAKPE